MDSENPRCTWIDRFDISCPVILAPPYLTIFSLFFPDNHKISGAINYFYIDCAHHIIQNIRIYLYISRNNNEMKLFEYLRVLVSHTHKHKSTSLTEFIVKRICVEGNIDENRWCRRRHSLWPQRCIIINSTKPYLILPECLNIRPMNKSISNRLVYMVSPEMHGEFTLLKICFIFWVIWMKAFLHLRFDDRWIWFLIHNQYCWHCLDAGSNDEDDDVYILVIIFKYSSALRAALVWAVFDVLPDPWHTATGNVDNWTKHWNWPE